MVYHRLANPVWRAPYRVRVIHTVADLASRLRSERLFANHDTVGNIVRVTLPERWRYPRSFAGRINPGDREARAELASEVMA